MAYGSLLAASARGDAIAGELATSWLFVLTR